MIPQLQRLIEGYLEGNKHRTLHTLAQKGGVSYSTVRRVAQGEVKAVDLANVIGILRVTSTTSETLAFLNQYFPGTGDLLEKIAKTASFSESWSSDGPDLEPALKDFETFVIVAMASTPNGVSRERVFSSLGTLCEDKIELLLLAGILEERNGVLKTTAENYGSTNAETIAAEFSHVLRFVRASLQGKEKQHCSLITNGLSREGQKKLHAFWQNAIVEAQAIVSENPGPIPVFCGTIMGQFSRGESNA